jgi:hypothetical protein
VPTVPKVYDFPMAKVEDKLVSFLKTRRGESTVADMISGTGLPKYQVEQAAKVVLDEFAGRLKVTESGELLYYFPAGMRSTVRGFGPGLRRAWRSFGRGTVRVLSFLFKIWIVAMLVGYFLAFVAIGVLAIVASVAASAAGRGGRDDRRGGDGGGFGGMFIAMQLLDLLLRMWFWSSILGTTNVRRRPPREGRAFYKSVFGFVFGDGDPNQGWEERERKHAISYIQGHKGVITLEELMGMTGREIDDANALMNRLLLEYEGEPGVTENGTLIYTFPELMRTSRSAKEVGTIQLQAGPTRRPAAFSANKNRTNGWIIFFNTFNLLFGTYFLTVSLTQGPAALASKTGLFAFTGSLLQSAGISPLGVLTIGLGLVPVLFSVVFFLVPFFRRIRLSRQNEAIRREALRKEILGQIISSPAHLDVSTIRPLGSDLDPRDFPAASRRILDRIAAQLKAEPVVMEGSSQLAYSFPELKRELTDLAEYRSTVDVSRYEVGKTVFDSGS